MKEATGELNMTVVTVVAIAAVVAFFYAFIWPGIRSSINASTYCSMAICPNGDYSNCYYYPDSDANNEKIAIDCTSYFEKQNETNNSGGEVTPP